MLDIKIPIVIKENTEYKNNIIKIIFLLKNLYYFYNYINIICYFYVL